MKLKGHQIIIFGLSRFDAPIEAANYTTAKLLARENEVYYIENPLTLGDFFRLRKKPEYQLRKGHFSLTRHSMIETDIPNLKVIIPPILLPADFLPENGMFRTILKFNELLIRTKLKSILQAYKIRDYIFINSSNFHYPTVTDGLMPRLKVYHRLDPVLPFNLRHGVVSEDILVKQSDVVICSSKKAYKEKKRQNPYSYFVANAADLGHSSKALNPRLPVNPAIAALKKPVVGYLGAIERQLDYDLLQKVILSNPDKSFAFVGPVSREFVPDWFFTAENVHFSGPVDHEDMPAVIKGFDVALIPFKKDEENSSIFPLNLFEYLGAGKPVVATDFNPDLKELSKGAVKFCENAGGFSQAITTALQTDDAEQRKTRVTIAAENTWESRVDAIGDIIYYHLEEVIQP
ncbi:glycosyltransferase involved in cell wall biosynthesis [Dyadobacter sp. BE34]|uniref:Glycosyltransferase involved in cell wall biosynthesis n=1 Tax=Dyadobacter fermentans TaxID=94254 RepID=A0ABU1QYB7_9BACT|nr:MULTISPECIES: glycosyltransferase [Dyadobacter]MDR6806151.1 glycosyltransferase involved in cell wall biosynthesis [Dyadobacter fermentans]MDR7043892.1 glycosyltransferase involved in cell wall biosynthesis [Dyadobacter sp. BE242]MDR7198203.1 glycosyltransferase involved in cell wall biosynthesis [Dyadobacter sp. BE34]MDR7216166.1 glycosyltransferase involved in cell wall biosynthesis [Dyadobacter sp. BE31]MDR7264308.1 glycosyltransferase involved in cell wall biosynthesis [Dyadobacter sp. 